MHQASRKNSKINILVAADHGGYNGAIAGIGRILSYTLPLLDRARFNIVLVILRDDGSLKARFSGTGIKIYHLQRKKFDPITLFAFIQLIKKEQIHLLHLYQYACSNFGRLAGKIMRVPTIVNLNDLNYNYPWYQWFADRGLRWANDSAIAVSEAVKKSGAKVRAIDPDKITVIPSAVATDHLKQLNPDECRKLKIKWGLRPQCRIVGTITRLHGVKGNHILLRAAKIVLKTLPDTVFVFVGSGPMMQELIDMSENLNIQKNVIFTGYQEDVAGFLSIFDIKVIASSSEGAPLALLEAMAMGKAVVATEISGNKEVLQEGENGLFVPPQNPEAMAEKIVFLLNNEQERQRLGLNAYAESRRFTRASHTMKLEKVYEKSITVFQKAAVKRHGCD